MSCKLKTEINKQITIFYSWKKKIHLTDCFSSILSIKLHITTTVVSRLQPDRKAAVR